jgi:hypothetical protein
MVEIATVFVVEPDEQSIGPRLGFHHGINDRRGKTFSNLDILRFFLRTAPEVGVDDAVLVLRQLSRHRRDGN